MHAWEVQLLTQITAIVSGKGGTGKTTLCAAIASCMAAEGKRVLCVDLDAPLRNLDLAMGMSVEPVPSYTEAFTGSLSMEDIPEHPGIPGLYLLSAPARLTEEAADREAMRTFLTEAREHFDEIFLDGPAGLGPIFEMCTSLADRTLLISAADPGSMRDAGQTAREIALAGCDEAYLILNRVQRGYFRLAGITVDDVMDQVGLRLLGLVPEDSQVPLASAKNTALVLYERRGAAPACLRIARRLNGRRIPLAIS